MILDRAGSATMSTITRIRLIGELGRLKQSAESLGTGPVAALGRLKLVKRANEIRAELNAALGEPEQIDNERSSEAYGHHDIRAIGARQKANNAAVSILNRVKSGELSKADLTEEDRKVLAAYSGTGGSLIGDDGKKGSAYEYYTPEPIAAGVWDALKDMGFKGGKILDPASGTGVFGATAPANAVVDAVELSEVSGSINSLLNDSATYKTTISPFEAVAAATPDEMYDAVVTNVPFGTLADRGGNQLKDGRYQKETLETYFILRSLDKLKPGGLAAFIVPPRCTTARGGADQKLRERASLKAEFLGAYRLPNKVFGAAAADTITDVIFFRKYSADTAQKIDELLEQSPATLSEAGVLWGDYIGGKYFDTAEGKRHVLGEFKAKDPDKFRDVDRVENPASVTEIAAMLRKLPDSRIDWELLNSTETMPISYSPGDTMYHGGQTLQMSDAGEWVTLDSSSGDSDMAELLGHCKDAYSAFYAGVTAERAIALVDYMHATGQSLDVPAWLAGATRAMSDVDESKKSYTWTPVVVGMAVRQLLDEVGRGSGVNFLNEYAALSGAMKANYSAAKAAKVQGPAKQALRELLNHYGGTKKGYSALWRGDIQTDVVVQTTEDMGIDGLKYNAQSEWLDIEQIKAIKGDDFDPMASDDWCISPDGKKVASADDYYVGNYQALLSAIDAQIQNAEGAIKDKLVRQRLAAASRVDVLDAGKMQFNLFSPYVTLEEKAEFLRRSVDPRAVVVFDESSGERVISFDIRGSNLTDRDKLLRRFAYHLKTSSVSLGGTNLGVSDKEGLNKLRGMIKTANEQFNGYVKANPRITSRLQAELSAPEKLRFRQVDDESPLQVPGIHPDFKPHGYQSSWVRKTGRDFAGINGFGVGLGKTASALIAVQYAQAMGVKKKTIFVVPNAVLSNWHKESVLGDPEKGTPPVYTSDEGCLFIGLRQKASGKYDVNTSAYDEDLNRILENRHSKIFMTAEAFERIPLKDDSIEGFEKYMRSVDASFAESENKKEDERKKGKAKTIVSILSGKNSASPYLEDMGVDSIVMDEGHIYKNSASTVDFTGAKFLSVSEPSRRGLDAQAKCWFVRKLTPRGDGVIPLTATPLTNSPLEVYSMLSLAYGHERINDMMGGISGADAFMNAVCNVEDEEEETIDGNVASMRVFKGLSNAPMLRNMLHQVATIKNADDVGNQITVPDAPTVSTPVKLTPEVESRLQLYKDAYRFALDTIKEKADPGGSLEAFEEVAGHFGEPLELIGHPFNLINKMTMLIADPDLDKQLTRYVTGSPEDAEKLAQEWNKGKVSEERKNPGPNAVKDDIISSKAIKKDGELTGYLYKVKVRAWAEGNHFCVDSTEWRTQDKIEKMADKLKIDLDVTVPVKLAAMLDNFQKEAAQPRGIDADGNRVKRAKQLIFCDLLAMHNKLRRLLVSKAGVKASTIAIVTGQRSGSPEDIQEVQDGFNGTNEQAKYDVVIGNKKIEVGVNLQRGTQAHHHLTIGWTPDSLTQRDGRGVRQGNKTGFVNIYHYDADGTFDTAKRTLVNVKSDWITDLMNPESEAEQINISSGLSREQMEALIEVIGDADGVSKLQEAVAIREAETRALSNRGKQLINLDTVMKQNKFIADYSTPTAWIGKYLSDLMIMMGARMDLRSRLANPKVTAGAEAKYLQKLSELEPRIKGLSDTISASASLTLKSYSGPTKELTPVEVVEAFIANAKRGENRATDLIKAIKTGRYMGAGTFQVDVQADSDLHNEWQSEIDLAEAIKAKAVENYAKQAEEKGAIDPQAASMLAAGLGEMHGDTPVYRGCFIVGGDDNQLAIYTGNGARGVWGNRDVRTQYVHSMVANGGRIVHPGSAEYDELAQIAATYEDEATEKGSTDNSFSEASPLVASLRKVEQNAQYLISGHVLPSPYFPVVITESDARESERLQAIRKSQAEIVKDVRHENGNYYFVVPASIDIQPMTVSEPLELFRDYYIANGIRAKRKDFGFMSYMVHLKILKGLVKLDSLKAFMEAREVTTENVKELTVEFLNKEIPWFDSSADSSLALSWEQQNYLKTITTPVSAVTASESDTDKVLIVGYPDAENTRKWKEQIKECSKKQDGKKAYWNGKEGGWNVSRGAYKLLLSTYPQAESEITIK